MTLGELLDLMKARWLFVVLSIFVCCTLTGAVIALAPTEYRASAKIIVNKEPVAVRGYARELLSEFEKDDVSLTLDINLPTKTIVASARGTNKEACTRSVNMIISHASDKAESSIADIQTDTTLATKAVRVSKRSITPQLLAIACVVGLMASLLLIVLHDTMRTTNTTLRVSDDQQACEE